MRSFKVLAHLLLAVGAFAHRQGTLSDTNSDPTGPIKVGQYRLVPQNDNTTCATYGESQWTGTIDVSENSRLFFWFFNSRNDPGKDPILLFMNGGPGSSSMLGLFQELGACRLDEHGESTVPNEWAWNNNASVIFLDQPAGTGFSSLSKDAIVPTNPHETAPDFQQFLNIFFSDVFPDRAHLPIHIAAESYGGHYGPVYVKYILDSRKFKSMEAFRGNISSLILVNAAVNDGGAAIGMYELLCSDYRGQILNDTSCAHMQSSTAECERLTRSCMLTLDDYQCSAMESFCNENISAFYADEAAAGKRSIYNILKKCSPRPNTTDTCDSGVTNALASYLNKANVLASLQYPANYTYQPVSEAIGNAFFSDNDIGIPTTLEVVSILEAYKSTGLGDIKILVLNGNEDWGFNTPGQQWVYDNLLWSGVADYRAQKWQSLPESYSTTGFWRGSSDGRLVFVGVDGAGHMVPGDQPEAAYHVFQSWITGKYVTHKG